MNVWKRAACVAFAALVAVSLAACRGPGTPVPSVADHSASAGGTASPGPVNGVLSVGERQNGRTVTVHEGDRIVVTLDSTYWHMDAPDGALRQVGEVVTTPAPKGTCLPGVGCGTVRQIALAASAGDGMLSAGRTTCGEAMGCRPDQARWTLRVVVRP